MSIFKEHKTIADRSASDRHVKKVEISCQNCQNIFIAKPSYAKRAKFCSKKCSSSQKRKPYKEKIKIVCKLCSKVFEKLPCHNKIKFCSVECKGKSYQKRFETNCLTCNLKFETTQGKNQKYCSKSCHSSSLSNGHSLEKLRNTNLLKYGVECVSQVQEFKHKKHESMKRNRTYGSSKIENKVYDSLILIYGKESVERQHSINGWAIDFFIKPLQIYLQVDGIYWHGLDRPTETLKTSKNFRDAYILSNRQKDDNQNKWFLENNLKLVRITDQQITSFNSLNDELINILETKQ